MSAGPMTIEGLTSRDVFLLIIGLERVRDQAKVDAAYYRGLPSKLEELAVGCDRESVEAEMLRERLKELPGYDVNESLP